MTEAHTMSRDLQEDILSTVRKSQAAAIEAIQTWTSTVQSITPDLPDLSSPFTDMLPKPHEEMKIGRRAEKADPSPAPAKRGRQRPNPR